MAQNEVLRVTDSMLSYFQLNVTMLLLGIALYANGICLAVTHTDEIIPKIVYCPLLTTTLQHRTKNWMSLFNDMINEMLL